MSDQASTAWFHGNRYSAHAACEHCGGAVRHEAWCITLNSAVSYAYQIVADPTVLTLGDALILHSLGVAWTGKANSPQGKSAMVQDCPLEVEVNHPESAAQPTPHAASIF